MRLRSRAMPFMTCMFGIGSTPNRVEIYARSPIFTTRSLAVACSNTARKFERGIHRQRQMRFRRKANPFDRQSQR